MKAFYKIFFLLWLVFLFSEKLQAQEVFNFQRELNQYIYQKSDLKRLTSGYFLNYLSDMNLEMQDSIFAMYNPNKIQKVTMDKLLAYTQIMEETDVLGRFKRDSLFFPAMNEIYANGGWNKTRIPLFISYLDFSFVNKETFESFLNHTGTEPFSSLTASQFNRKSMAVAGLLMDSLINNHLNIYWDDHTVFTNSDKQIEQVQLIIGRDTVVIPKNTDFSLEEYYTYSKPLTAVSFRITFDDKTSFTVDTKIFSLKYSKKDNVILMDDFAKAGNYFPWMMMKGGFEETASIQGATVRLDFNVLWGCDPQGEKTLDKPFIMVSGWGPYTGNFLINGIQGWPSTNEHFYWSINQKGYVDSLVGAGFDVVFVKFFPPNASVLQNSHQLEKLINIVNVEKFSQNSYQENIISGYSAGSMAIRLTLERMEKNHLDNANKPHHHCKLFVSFDGEQGGANVPLGLQHAVNYLQGYHNPLGVNLKIYALNYILNAPLSQELLKYFHTKTGNSSNPGQGAHPNRTAYLQYYSTYNHAKNTQNPFYPAFTRNISISNGSSQRTATSSTNTYYPYSTTDGDLIFKNTGTSSQLLNENTEVYMLGQSSGLVFRNELKPLFKPWYIRTEAVTKNAWILDNAPGGTTFLASNDPNKCGDENITYNVLDRLEAKTQPFEIGNADFIKKDAMYSFTPTILTHDIRNFTPTTTAGGGRMYYDMKAEGLMFTSISNKLNNLPSPYYGYPHLAHPTNHYTNYTPFDAVFSFDADNTVHIQSGHAQWNGNKNSLNCSGADKHERWEQHDSPIRAVMRSFILGEADTYNAYIQNRHYGWNANDNYTYKADVVSKNNIFAGDSVTQRTDFKKVIIEPNADVQFIACNAVHIKPGFHAKAGSKFHAKIDTDNCIYCPHSRPQSKNGRSVRNMEFEMEDELSTMEEDIDFVRVYPNPSVGYSNIEVLDENVTSFEYMVYDIMGKLIHHETVEGRNIRFELKKGIYIIQTKINESWYTKKLIMQ